MVLHKCLNIFEIFQRVFCFLNSNAISLAAQWKEIQHTAGGGAIFLVADEPLLC